MSRNNAFIDTNDFDDDFGLDGPGFDDFEMPGQQSFADHANPGLSELESTFGEDPTSYAVNNDAGVVGDMTIPRITIHAFCERGGTARLVEAASADRRLAKANVTIDDGGLTRAIEYYSEVATPDLLIIESSAPGPQMLAQIDALAELCDPNIRVLVIGAMNDVALYRQLVARGVSEYLVPPFQPLQLIQSIGSLYVDPEKPFIGRSVAVIGAKGGVGASSIAHNLAWSISENIEINTTLVDLDLSWGTTSLDFNQEGTQTVFDALADPERVDENLLERLLTRATDRLSLFTAPGNLTDDSDITDDAYDQVIEHVRKTVPFVVLDLPHVWSAWMKTTVLNSDDIVVVCAPDLASLRNGKNLIDYLSTARNNDSPPRLVVNMVGMPKRPEIPVKDFAAAIGIQPDLVLPFEPQVFGAASNNGQMLSEAAPESRAAQGIDHLAGGLTGREIVEKQTGLLSKILKR